MNFIRKFFAQLLQYLIVVFVLIGFPAISQNQDVHEAKPVVLDNPVTPAYLKQNLSKKSPRLILTPSIEKEIARKLKTDPLVQNFHQYLQAESEKILGKPLLKRELEGFRLLAVSREMVERMGILCMVYRLDKNPLVLKRIEAEVKAVCDFEDWNPQHYLDVAEMSLAVALAVDWAGEFLPKGTVQLAKKALIEKGILPSYREDGPRMGWINGTNNWNAVCHGGMIAASLVIAGDDPELAARTISRALEKLPSSLKEYGPDGVYPEGPTYWEYGTSYTVVASNVLTTALGSDFGISRSTGFFESAHFRLQATAPSGAFFNFADSGDRHGGSGSVLLSWFAAKTGNGLYFDHSFFENPQSAGRFAGPGLVWLSQYKNEISGELPLSWMGRGANPIGVFRGGKDAPGSFYLAFKGGKAQLSHGNMDAGTFILDLNGVRWVLDPGNQSYYPLNRIGFNLSGHCQDCERWTLLTKGNQGHSTVTVNNARFNAAGYAPIVDFKDGSHPEATIDMSRIYEGHLNSMTRRFVKESNSSVLVEDRFVKNDSTSLITWAIMTVADVIPTEYGALLQQDGKELRLSVIEPAGLHISVISLDPPPMEIDKTIKNLKRVELRIPAWTVTGPEGSVKVRLSAE